MVDHEAPDLATTLITLLEGAHILCRATGTLDPFDSVARTAMSMARGGNPRQPG